MLHALLTARAETDQRKILITSKLLGKHETQAYLAGNIQGDLIFKHKNLPCYQSQRKFKWQMQLDTKSMKQHCNILGKKWNELEMNS